MPDGLIYTLRKNENLDLHLYETDHMTQIRLQLFASVTCLVACLVTGCVTLPDNLKPDVTGVTGKITGIDFEGVTLNVALAVRNPYPVPIKTPQFSYEIGVEDKSLFRSNGTSSIDLPARNTGTVSFPVTIRYQDLADILSSARSLNEIGYSVNGSFEVAPLGQQISIPFSHKGKLPVLRPPTFSNLSAVAKKISFLGSEIQVSTDILNPNIIPIDLSGIGYSIGLGGQPLGSLKISSPGKLRAGGKTRLTLTGNLSASAAIMSLLRQKTLPTPSFTATGAIKTPYGEVRLPSK